jgi:hypothetical protein
MVLILRNSKSILPIFLKNEALGSRHKEGQASLGLPVAIKAVFRVVSVADSYTG